MAVNGIPVAEGLIFNLWLLWLLFKHFTVHIVYKLKLATKIQPKKEKLLSKSVY